MTANRAIRAIRAEMRFIGLVLVYLVVAGVFGWWPFEDSAVKTITGQCTYDAGYRDAWEGMLPACENADYLDGYDHGSWEADCHHAKCVERDRDLFEGYRCRGWNDMTC